MLTIKEIAKLAKVSPATVSRVLNNHPNVRPEIRERVKRIVEEQNYIPHAAARSLSTRRTDTICLLLVLESDTDMSGLFFSAMLQSVVRRCNYYGLFTVLSLLSLDEETEFQHRGLGSHQFDGILVHVNGVDDPILPILAESDLPVVLMDRHPTQTSISWAAIDNFDGAYQAVQHLVALGHRRIATITGPLSKISARDRLCGYKQALLDTGFKVDEALIVEGSYSGHEQVIGKAVQQLLDLTPPPTAIFAGNDSIAFTAIRVIEETGLLVPEDIALVGFDGFMPSPFPNLTLTTVRYPMVELCQTAVDSLVYLLQEDDTRPLHKTLPVEFVAGQSSGDGYR